jgi:hypothetical protein
MVTEMDLGLSLSKRNFYIDKVVNKEVVCGRPIPLPGFLELNRAANLFRRTRFSLGFKYIYHSEDAEFSLAKIYMLIGYGRLRSLLIDMFSQRDFVLAYAVTNDDIEMGHRFCTRQRVVLSAEVIDWAFITFVEQKCTFSVKLYYCCIVI